MANTGNNSQFKLLIYSGAFMYYLYELYLRGQLFIMMMLHKDCFCVLLCREYIFFTVSISESYGFTNIAFEIAFLINSSMDLCSSQMKIEKKKEKEKAAILYQYPKTRKHNTES